MGLGMDVREILLEIIRKHGTHGFVPCATEIENIILMFIDWLVREVRVTIKWQDGVGYVKEWRYEPDNWRFDKDRHYPWLTEELFVHWYKEVYEK